MTEAQPVDLSNCDREPIHVPGSIQPHGGLLACDATAARVIRHSANANAILGLPDELNDMAFEAVFGATLAHDIRNALSRAREGSRPALLFGRACRGRLFDISVHRFKGNAIIEFEEAQSDVGVPLELTRSMIERLSDAETPDRLITRTARIIHATLGYDRVMVYKFGHDGAGKVIAEAKRPNLESFLGQYFPATDIPQQARVLYLRNTIRVISDASCERVPIIPTLDASGTPLDLSFAHLRSVSPIHCEYLRNMGVGASMSISVIIDGALWGLIACHHYGPRVLSMAQRVAAEMFGEFFSLHLSALNQKDMLKAATTARAALDRLLHDAANAREINASLRGHLADFAGLIACDGVGLWLDGQWSALGTVPDASAVPTLVAFAETVADGTIWATHQLAEALPSAVAFSGVASGMLIVPLSQRPRDYLFFFRREVVQTLDWAGNPEKTYEVGPLGDRLTPRKSFAIWKETVRMRAEPWTDTERHLAETARVALVEVALRHSELLSDERAKAEIRQRVLNEELNHRVKNILAVIQSLVTQPTHEKESLEAYVASLKGRIQALSHAHDQVIRSGGGGSLPRLIDAELAPYRRNPVRLDGPGVWLDARAYSILALVLHELATNAAKYGALSNATGALSVRWDLDATGGCRIAWEERGGPAVTPPARRGFGSLLIDRSLPYDLGGRSEIRYDTNGVRAELFIPARFVSLREADIVAARLRSAEQTAGEDTLTPLRVFAVEDQLLIAMELEQILQTLGHQVAATATTQTEALAFLASEQPDVAILDVNLGETTSERIAEVLAELRVPFMFATGYADSDAIPARFRSVPVVRKPYAAADIDRGLRRLLSSNPAP